jgi:hypothetical protein
MEPSAPNQTPHELSTAVDECAALRCYGRNFGQASEIVWVLLGVGGS